MALVTQEIVKYTAAHPIKNVSFQLIFWCLVGLKDQYFGNILMNIFWSSRKYQILSSMLGNFCYEATILQKPRCTQDYTIANIFWKEELLHLIRSCIIIFQELMKHCMIKLSNSDGNWFELSIHKNGDFVGNSDVIKKQAWHAMGFSTLLRKDVVSDRQ